MSEQTTPVTEASDGAPEHPLLQALRARFPDAVIATHCHRGDATAIVKTETIVDVCTWLRDDPSMQFDMLVDLTGVDYIGRRPRFECVYHLLSLPRNHRLRLKVPVEEADPSLPSVVPVWVGANWLEREAWDLYGFRFVGHPDLRRIYLYEEFVGHPLRKDYPKEKRQPLVGPGAPAALAGGVESGS